MDELWAICAASAGLFSSCNSSSGIVTPSVSKSTTVCLRLPTGLALLVLMVLMVLMVLRVSSGMPRSSCACNSLAVRFRLPTCSPNIRASSEVFFGPNNRKDRRNNNRSPVNLMCLSSGLDVSQLRVQTRPTHKPYTSSCKPATGCLSTRAEPCG